MNDIQAQKPFTTSQIKQTKPNVPSTTSILSGYIANSMNGGHDKVIAFKQVMAGEKHKEYRLNMNIQMLTPLTPAYQQLKMTIRTYFVPNSRVWKNAEKYTAQKGGTSEIKIEEIPNLYGKVIPQIIGQTENQRVGLQNTTIWRDSFISTYIPRVNGNDIIFDSNYETPLPKVSVLPLRGRVAIYNDLERNKEYSPEMMEYNGDTVSDEEWESYLPLDPNKTEFYQMRSRRENNYYTDYRTELQGLNIESPIDNTNAFWEGQTQLLEWAAWESKINEARAEAENAQKTDWEIIAEIRGSKLLTEGKVQLIGQKTFNLSYNSVTQNTYNNNEDINPEFKVMGKQGAYSYTNINTAIYAGFEFNEEGYVHVIATISADTAFINGFDRLELNCTPLEQYRPELKDEKLDVLKLAEMTTVSGIGLSLNQLYQENVGFKRKFSEYFKLPNLIRGDMEEKEIFRTYTNANLLGLGATTFNTDLTKILPNDTYQFFEQNILYLDNVKIPQYNDPTPSLYNGMKKNIWKDYTDIMINKNLAIKETVFALPGEGGETNIWVDGQNQVFFVGVATCLANLPIDEAIKNNFTKWGEH